VDTAAMGNEPPLVGGGVLPAHLAGLLDLHGAALGGLLLQHASFIGMREVGGEILDAVVLLLKGARRLGRRGTGLGTGLRRNEQQQDERQQALPSVAPAFAVGYGGAGSRVQFREAAYRRFCARNASTSPIGRVFRTRRGSTHPRRAVPTPSRICRSRERARWQSL